MPRRAFVFDIEEGKTDNFQKIVELAEKLFASLSTRLQGTKLK